MTPAKRAVILCPAVDAHAVALAATMRAVDVAEVAAMGAASPLEALRASLSNSSHAVTALDKDGRVICMFGVGSHGFLSNEGVPWLLASDLLRSHLIELARRAPAFVDAMLDQYPELSNVVDARAGGTIRWLEGLGFTVEAAEPTGADGALLCRFWRIKGKPRRPTVQATTVAAVMGASNFDELVAEYAVEATVAGLPSPAAKMATYRELESRGVLRVISATIGYRLIGFVTVVAPVMPHYDASVAVSESFFVAKAYRKTGAGLGLLRAAEDMAASLGSPGLLVSAPYAGDLFRVLPRRGYVETNRIFFKKVDDVSYCVPAVIPAARANIPAMSPAAIDKVTRLEALARQMPQVPIDTDHVIHGGMYARTVLVKAGHMMTGVLIKLATLVIVQGDAVVFIGVDDGDVVSRARLTGYHVLAASAGRKQAFVAMADTHITMIFPTDAPDVATAEAQFTDDVGSLASRRDVDRNTLTVTGE